MEHAIERRAADAEESSGLLLISMTGEKHCANVLSDHIIEPHCASLAENRPQNDLKVVRIERAFGGVFHQTFSG
jgi:hypothetical protein